MYDGEYIYDYYPEIEESISLFKRLRGRNKLLFAIRDFEKQIIESSLNYKIDGGILTSSDPEVTLSLIGISKPFMWFEPKNDDEIAACIKYQVASYFGCVVEPNQPLSEAIFVFRYFELLTVNKDFEAALFIGAKEFENVKKFVVSLKDYIEVEVTKTSHIWVSKNSDYIELWRE